MAETDFEPVRATSPLDGRRFLPVAGLDLEMTPCDECARFSLQMDPENRCRAEKALNLVLQTEIGGMRRDGDEHVLCLGPGEWMLICTLVEGDRLISSLEKVETEIPHSLVDVNDRFVGLEILGTAATRVISAGCPLDLETMSAGACARSILEQVPVIVLKFDAAHYRVEFSRSHGDFAWRFLEQSARFSQE